MLWRAKLSDLVSSGKIFSFQFGDSRRYDNAILCVVTVTSCTRQYKTKDTCREGETLLYIKILVGWMPDDR